MAKADNPVVGIKAKATLGVDIKGKYALVKDVERIVKDLQFFYIKCANASTTTDFGALEVGDLVIQIPDAAATMHYMTVATAGTLPETQVWHTLSKNLDMISPLVNAVNAEHRVITDELAPKDDKGTPVRNQQNQIDFGDNLEEANKRWDNIMSEEIEIEIITIPLDDLKDYGLDANMMKPLLGKLVLEK